MRCLTFGITVFCIARLSLVLIGCQSGTNWTSGVKQTPIVHWTPEKQADLDAKTSNLVAGRSEIDRAQAKLIGLEQQAANNQNQSIKEALEAEEKELTEKITKLEKTVNICKMKLKRC